MRVGAGLNVSASCALGGVDIPEDEALGSASPKLIQFFPLGVGNSYFKLVHQPRLKEFMATEWLMMILLETVTNIFEGV
jgi:hypothetical protein